MNIWKAWALSKGKGLLSYEYRKEDMEITMNEDALVKFCEVTADSATKALRAENERLRALGKEITHDSQTLSQNNMDLRKRLAQAEKVIEAAKELRHAGLGPVMGNGRVVSRVHMETLVAVLAEWEGNDGTT